MGERWRELVLAGLLLWTAVGLLGTVVAFVRSEQERAGRGLRALGVVWLVYAAVLLGASWRQGVRLLRVGQSQCFDGMCFAVEGAEEVEGFRARGTEPERLLRVDLRMWNAAAHGARSADGLRAVLVDDAGRRWAEVPGLSGVRLGSALPAGGVARSEPVFRVGHRARGLRLELRHEHWTMHTLMVGDAESLLHRPAEMLLPAGF